MEINKQESRELNLVWDCIIIETQNFREFSDSQSTWWDKEHPCILIKDGYNEPAAVQSPSSLTEKANSIFSSYCIADCPKKSNLKYELHTFIIHSAQFVYF